MSLLLGWVLFTVFSLLHIWLLIGRVITCGCVVIAVVFMVVETCLIVLF